MRLVVVVPIALALIVLLLVYPVIFYLYKSRELAQSRGR